jgi:sirohydrochlorin cobaltochelatase
MIMAIVPVVLSWIRISDSHRKMDSCALPGISSGSIHIIMCLRTRRKMKMKLKKAMLLFAAAAVAAGTVAGCSGSAKETTAASVAETSAEETEEETTAEETKEEETAAEEEDEENYDTGDAALDNTRNQDEIGEKELLVVSFGTSYNDSRRLTIGAIEDAIEKAEPDFSVRRGFTSQIIIDHVKKRDDVTIDNVTEALDRAVNNGVKTLVVQPTHLMNGLEYTDLVNEIAENADSFEKVVVGEPLLTSDDDFKAVIQAITDATKEYDDGETAICFMGHGTEADSNQVYAKMQDMLTEEGFEHYYVGTVEATPSLEDVVAKVKEGSYKKVVLEPLMIVAGDHANNDMAGDEEGSWKTTFEEAGYEVTCLVRGLGELEPIQQLFVEHAKAAVDSLAK